jgi:hypothetical protein
MLQTALRLFSASFINHGYLRSAPPATGLIPLELQTSLSSFSAGLFNLPIPMRFARHAPGFAFEIGVSQKKRPKVERFFIG